MIKETWALLAVALVGWGCSYDTSGPDVGFLGDGPTSDRAVELGLDLTSTPDSAPPDTVPPKPTLIILHTNDLHEHLMGWSPNADYTPHATGDDQTVGGFARLASAIHAERAAAAWGASVLLLDGGDWSMGTLFTWLGATDAPVLTLMEKMGYDAVVLGNHEFEWGPSVLAQRINTAIQAGVKVNILSSNIEFSDEPADTGDDALKQLQTTGVIKKLKVLTLSNGLKVGLFGLMGKAAADVALDKDPVAFSTPPAVPNPLDPPERVKLARQLVKELRTVDKVDVVIALSHSGIDPAGEGEDADLAKAVPGIDVIISGHTHDQLPQPIQVGKTYIVQTGKFGMALGRMELTFDAAKTLGRVDYRLIPLDDTIPGDAAVQKIIDGHIATIDTLLKPDLAYKQVVAETAFDLTKAPFQETRLGNLISDAYRMTVNKLQPTEPADLAVASSGHIRDEVLKGKTGKIWFADLYRALPLGMGPDNKPGYPLVTYYLKGKEIKTWMEMLYLSEKIAGSKSMFFEVSGIQVEYDKSGLIVVPLFTVDSVKLTSAPGAPEIKDSNGCYKVVSSLAIAKELTRAKEYTFGIWKIEPKLKDCSTTITDLTQRIVDAEPGQPGLQELKGWQALTQHVSGFPDTDANGIPNIPASYATLQSRIIAK